MELINYPSLSAIEINCQRFLSMITWYRELIDAQVEFRDEIQCWLKSPTGWRLVLLNTGLAARPRDVAGVSAPSFEYGSLAQLTNAYKTLCSRNIYPERSVKNGFHTTLKYRDPDNNDVSLRFVLPSGNRSEGAFNPLGEEFNAQVLLNII